MKVVHVALTPLAGAAIRVVNALNRHTEVSARLVLLNPDAYEQRTFEGDLVWGQDKETVLPLLLGADVLHFHHFFELEHNPFGIDFTKVSPRARFLRQFHTHPLTIAQGDRDRARHIVESDIPQLVIAQYHERFFPRARVVPNIVPLTDELYRPIRRVSSDPVLFFAPTVDYPAWSISQGGTRWDTKGARETEALLRRVVKVCGKGQVTIRRNIPHEQCLREKQASDIVIDEMVTGSFHLSSLEALAQGLPTFAYLDSRCLETLSELTGSNTNPWLNFRIEEAEGPLAELIKDDQLRKETGDFGRVWMENYYSDHEMIKHYVRAYEELLERPETFTTSRFNTRSPRQIFLAQRHDDLIWESRKNRILAQNTFSRIMSGNGSVVVGNKNGAMPDWIKLPVHKLVKRYSSVRADEIQALKERLANMERLLELVSDNETNRWLYRNRFERMDATLDIFDEKRREFHLDRYRFAAQRVKGKRVLDCACGTGYGARMLQEIGTAATVVGVDIEAEGVAYAMKNHRPSSVEFVCSSGDRLALEDNSVDAIISFETIEHVPDDRALISEFHRVLRSDGIVIISTPNQWPLSDTPYHLREYNRESFMEVLDEKFTCMELYNQNSGSATPLNRGQARGIMQTTSENEHLAECYIAVCRHK